MTETVNLLDLRKPFPPEQVGKLPRGGIQLDYVGHADVTDRLLSVDPEWNWEPKSEDEHGLPLFDTDRNGNPVGLWIKLTVGSVTRLGYGSCPSNQNDAVKVLIGDALRNAAMRFGVALDLWAKGDRADPTRENATASAGQASRRGQSAADAFENAAPAPPRQNGSTQQRGQVSRPAQPAKPAAAAGPEEIDIDAQAFADEAHGAISLNEMEDITRRSREAGKLTALVRNPSSDGKGKPGKLAVYLDWKRKQVKELDDALNELNAAADQKEMDMPALIEHVRLATGTDLEVATTAQIRQATDALRVKAAAL